MDADSPEVAGDRERAHDDPDSNEQPKSKNREAAIAIVAIIATLIVGVFGSWLTYKTSLNQSRDARDQSTSEFRREERKEAYSTVLTNITKLENAEREQLADATFDPTQPNNGFSGLLTTHEALNIFWDSIATVELIGSTEVTEKLLVVRVSHMALLGAWAGVESEQLAQPRDQQALDKANADYHEKLLDTFATKRDFIMAAKSDLDLDD